MRKGIFAFLSAFIAPFAAFSATEGVPSYYQNSSARGTPVQYKNAGYTPYVGTSGTTTTVGTRTYSYQVPRATGAIANGTMTTNGVAMPASDDNGFSVYAGYSRRFADFEFKTGVNSILEWDDMVFDEINVGGRYNFTVRNFDMFAYADYTYGKLNHGGLSMDYDLEPFSPSQPEYGIFTISIGDQSGTSHHLKFGIGAHHVWDIAGWKLSPSFGYEIFKHDLKMSDHIYPNPGVYLPLLTNKGDYVYGDAEGNYYSVPMGTNVSEDWFQVCMSPEDIKLVQASGSGLGSLGTSLITGDYDPTLGTTPWGVGPGECVIIGGDGPIIVGGTTHIYNTTWSGFYVGLEIEKQMTLSDKLRFYVQLGLPKYSSEGIWPNRDDWQQNPSFLDEGSDGAYSYAAEMEYNYRLSDRLQLALKVDTNYFHVGKIPGELYVAGYSQFQVDDNGEYVLDQYGNPVIETIAAHTEHVTNSLESANWQSFGLHLGLKYSF